MATRVMVAVRAVAAAVVLSGAGASAQALSTVPLAPAQDVGGGGEADPRAALLAGKRPVALSEALKLAAVNSPDLKAARAQVAQAAAKASGMYAVFRPEVKATASYVRTSAEQKFATSGFVDALTGTMEAAIRGAGPAYGIPMQAQDVVVEAMKTKLHDQLAPNFTDTTIVGRDSLYGTFVISQVLFSPQMFLAPGAGDAVNAATYGGLEAREQVLLATAKLYLGLEGLGQIQAAAKDAERVALKREKDAVARANVGTATDIDLLRAQSETAQARTLLANLAGQEVALLALLEALCGEPVRPNDAQPTSLTVQRGAEADAPWTQTWLVRSNASAVALQERFNTADRVGWAPTLVAQGKASYNSNSGFAGTHWILDGIVAAEWQLYDRGVRYSTMHENDAKTVAARAQLEAARTKAKATWLGAKANLDAAQVALTQAEAQATLAARAQKQAEAAREVGMLSSLEMSDIDSRRFLAASAVGQARAQLEVRKVELLAAEGRLARLAELEAEKL